MTDIDVKMYSRPATWKKRGDFMEKQINVRSYNRPCTWKKKGEFMKNTKDFLKKIWLNERNYRTHEKLDK